jgi:hypothetical protein
VKSNGGGGIEGGKVQVVRGGIGDSWTRSGCGVMCRRNWGSKHKDEVRESVEVGVLGRE